MADRGRHGPRMQKEWTSIPGIALALVADATTLGGSIALNTSATIIRMLGDYVLVDTVARFLSPSS